ncbi:MAG: respiratory nitrate reductase subunit gamma [Anaerolineaceae bacterium]|jgi:nitrate reductase gamma subunit|nr:respiratory nitrate reductase subunit gamma [Anaerolineaceae bacterium]OQY89581.1 MAG: respiratory nitrate reductase subunit gamma [Anaerolineae bacterium UTCFX1]
MFDNFLFIGFPYLAVAIAIAVTIYRFWFDPYSVSSQSSQFLENRKLFFGSVPWHYGVTIILLGHITALLFPGVWGLLTANQTRLYVLEITGLALALMATVGLVLLFYRRMANARAYAVTSELDWALLIVLLLQVGLGFWVAYYYRWGSDWYLRTAVPWLVSLLKLQPNIAYVTALPFWVKFHFVGGFVIILLLPFTRLVHLLVFPISYLWREHQVVIWNRSRMN